MAKSYLDYDGLLYLWQKIKTLFASKDEAMTSAEKTKLSGIAAGAEVNQNAFDNVQLQIGSTSYNIGANSKGDTFRIVQGDNVTLTQGSNNAVTVSATDTTYSEATTEASGLMSSGDKTKLNGIETGAQVNQNAFGTINNISAQSPTDSFTISPGTNVTITTLSTGVKINSSVPAGYAKTSSPTFTGTPQAPTQVAGDNSAAIATTAFVTRAINNAIGDITGLSFEVVTALPTTGAAGTIYLLSNGGSGQNIYDEYVWVNNKFEKIGTTDVDLSNYISTSDAITNSQIDTILAS